MDYKHLQKREPDYKQCFRITMSLIYTGDNDDIPTYLFYGTQQDLMQRVCERMMQRRCGMFSSLRLRYNQVEKPRNGFARVYHAIEVHGLNTDMITAKSLSLIFQRAIMAETPSRVTFHPFARFINM